MRHGANEYAYIEEIKPKLLTHEDIARHIDAFLKSGGKIDTECENANTNPLFLSFNGSLDADRWASLEVGESFVVTRGHGRQPDRVREVAERYEQTSSKRFVIRTVKGGTRITRIA